MRAALIASTAGHALIIGWGLVSLPFAEPLNSLEKPLPVDLVSVDEFTKITAGEEKAEPKPVPAPPKPKPEVVEAARETEKPEAPKTQRTAPVIADAPKPEPRPEEMRTASLPRQVPAPAPAPAPAPPPAPAAAEPAPPPPAETTEPPPQRTDVPLPPPAPPRPKVAEIAKPEPQPETPKPVEAKPEPPKPEPPAPARPEGGFDADRIAALLNKVPEAGGATSGSGAGDPGQGAPDATDATLTISEIDALRRQIAQCWSPPIGVLEAGRMVVKLDLMFNPDGTLTRDPQLLNPNGQPIFMIAAEAAIRAVISCQPYGLPPEKYDLWRQVHVNFDPREMLGG